MNKYKFSIPNRDANIFCCDIYDKNNNFLYHRKVHVYDKNLSDELNTTILTEKMAATLNVKERDLFIPIRMAVLLGESIWQNTTY